MSLLAGKTGQGAGGDNKVTILGIQHQGGCSESHHGRNDASEDREYASNGHGEEVKGSAQNGAENTCSKLLVEIKSRKTQTRIGYLGLAWIIFLTAPLAVIFSVVVFAHSLGYVYDEYITKIFAAADWRHTDRLSEEMTYYDRWCDVSDITSFSMDDFIVGPNKATNDIFETMMVHGLSVFPGILSPNTTASLRKFVMRRNKEMTPAEAIPLDGEENRWSFAIGGNDDPSVSQALKEVATNVKLRTTLEKLLGPDPAVVEITAITSSYGAENQGMHSDVKALGSSVKYSRTFTHSYSLFIGLQDTTEQMGATQICPGTHYCANDLHDECSEHGFTLASDGPWKEGDAMLLNQCLWHRGTEYTDPEAQHRAVFVVTFLNRPQFGVDNRQLSHGTYFHIRWDMWGHTLNDLLDTAKYMPWPNTVLRSSGIWKHSGRKWGWDWLTVASLRIANEENGYTFEELLEWVRYRNALGLPDFLRGPLLDRNGGWAAFISGTIQNVRAWTLKLNTAALGIYTILLILSIVFISKWNGAGSEFFLSSMKYLLFTHSTIATIGCFLILMVNKSEWAEQIKSGRLLARPFPEISPVETADNSGPTTVPEKGDVLIGCRFDSTDLAAYDSFLDYHPGNRAWLQAILSVANSYPSFTDLSSGFRDALISHVLEDTLANKSRFLRQNKFGDWIVLTKRSSREYTLREIVKMNHPLIRALDREVAYMLADSRFGLKLRSTKLGQKHSQLSLERWREQLFLRRDNALPDDQELFKPISSVISAGGFTPRSLAALPRPGSNQPQHASSPTQDAGVFKKGDDVEIGWNGRILRGTILGFEQGEVYVQYLVDGDREYVSDDLVRHYTGPFEEGDRVEAEYQGDGWFPGTITYVYADRRFDVHFDDGDESFGLSTEDVRRVLKPMEG
uniref:Uncharacterized protein n=1 Tax=Odontella aurita TaxID=265563 RepID=A0A7S4KCP2_9STRA|mmetsp:Transcript_8886/g.26621  ORF Transcript_8886/g.26621 Transcript_8886/m.26621 type:complete len:907 (+) Transcript_8886:169-2889(+)